MSEVAPTPGSRLRHAGARAPRARREAAPHAVALAGARSEAGHGDGARGAEGQGRGVGHRRCGTPDGLGVHDGGQPAAGGPCTPGSLTCGGEVGQPRGHGDGQAAGGAGLGGGTQGGLAALVGAAEPVAARRLPAAATSARSGPRGRRGLTRPGDVGEGHAPSMPCGCSPAADEGAGAPRGDGPGRQAPSRCLPDARDPR
jgi:hypothetical protein